MAEITARQGGRGYNKVEMVTNAPSGTTSHHYETQVLDDFVDVQHSDVNINKSQLQQDIYKKLKHLERDVSRLSKTELEALHHLLEGFSKLKSSTSTAKETITDDVTLDRKNEEHESKVLSKAEEEEILADLGLKIVKRKLQGETTDIAYAIVNAFRSHDVVLQNVLFKGMSNVRISSKFGLSIVDITLINRSFNVSAYFNPSKYHDKWLEECKPLHIAVACKATSAAQMLLDKGADINETACQWSPLMVAATEGNAETVKLLLKHGAPIDYTTVNNFTALYVACRFNGLLDVVDVLISHGALVNCATQNGYSPLHGSAVASRLDIMTLLINKGAMVNAATSDGTTALHLAAQFASLDCVRYLVSKRANVNVKTNKGFTPVDLAREGNKAFLMSSPNYVSKNEKSYA